MEERTPLLKVENLKQYFPISKKFTVKAVDDVSFEIYPGETYGLVGESGSGKTTIGRSIIRLYDPTAGKITFDGVDITGKMSAADEKKLRTEMQMIFQDPMACLNPRQKVADIIGQGLDIGIGGLPLGGVDQLYGVVLGFFTGGAFGLVAVKDYYQAAFFVAGEAGEPVAQVAAGGF